MRKSSNIWVFFLLLTFGFQTKAQELDSLFTAANKNYQQEDYVKALEGYLMIEEKEFESAELYYNMANSYYKMNQVAPAIYYYEKALTLSPNNKDIIFNLEFANQMTLDNIEPLPKSVGQKLMDAFVLRFTYEVWAKVAVVLAFVFALLFLMYHFSYSTSKKRVYFVSSIVSVLLVTTSLFFAYRNFHHVENNISAIIYSNQADVKNAPTKSSELYFEIHEGTKVQILESLDDWKKIKIADGKIGWIESSHLRVI